MLSSDGQQLKVWDMAQGGSTLKMRPKSPGYTWSATSVMFDTNSDTIIAADTGGTVRLWDTKSGLLESEFLSPGGGIQDVALGGRGGPVALLQGDVVKLWDPRSRRILETLRPSNPVRTLFGKRLSFNPDGAELLYVSANGPQIWRMADGTMRATIKRARQITAAVFSPDGSAIAIAGSGLEMLDAKSLRSLAVLDKETALNCLAFDPAGRQVAAVDGRDILIWDVPARKLRGRLRGREGIQALAFNPDGSRLVCGGGRVDPAIQIWDTVTLKLLLTLRDHVRTVTSIAFSPDGTKFASASLDGSIIAWKSMLPGLSPPPNRARLVASALVERLYEDCLIATNVIRQLERDESLDWEVRHEALRLASLRDDTATADGLNALSWSVVSLPGKEPSAYQAALRQAKAACGLRPEAPFLNTLGVAYYRAGEFENAIATLERADQSNRGTYNRASDLLFIAMGHQKLGRKQKAVDLLKEARSQMEGDGGASGDLVEFAREAGQLIEKSP